MAVYQRKARIKNQVLLGLLQTVNVTDPGSILFGEEPGIKLYY